MRPDPSVALPQALTSLSSVRVGYTTRKNTVKPTGELKAQIDALDAQIAEAGRLGRTGELRRLYAKGITLLAGRAWTDAADYSSSLVLRTPAVVVDSSKPYSVRLEQIYLPSLALPNAVTARVGPAPASGAAGAEPAAAGAGDRQGLRHLRRRRARPARIAVPLRPRAAGCRRRTLPVDGRCPE